MNNKLFRNASSGAAQTIVSALLLFFLYRFLLQTLGAEQLGIWAVVLASTSVARLSDMGLSGAALKFVAKNFAAGKQDVASNVVQTASISIGAVLAVLLMLVYPLLKIILAWVVPTHALAQAISILPWAVLSLWFGLVAGIFQSALDGCGRMDIRNIILIVCNVLYLGGAFWLVPSYGLEGLAKGQFVQSVVLAAMSWLAIRKQLPNSPWLPYVWKLDLFKQMFRYALNFQISSLGAMLFDPVVKFLITKFGGLSDVAFYEMANQVIMKVRGVLISAFQAVVPAIAGVAEDDHEKLVSMYRKSYRVLSFIAVPYFMGFCMALPLISILWIGHIEIKFVTFGGLLCVGWMLSNVGVPAYFHNIGTGHLAWNTATHLMTTALLLPMAIVLGGMYGGFAVVASAMFALVLPNLILAIRVQKRLGLGLIELLPREHLWLFLVVLVGVATCVFLYHTSYQSAAPYKASAIALALYTCISAAAVWLHPYRRELVKTIIFRNR